MDGMGEPVNSRGAKKGGITEHIAGYHLIPNCGREAMVPAECVRRQRPKAKPKPKPEPVKPPQKQPNYKERRRMMKAKERGHSGHQRDASSDSSSSDSGRRKQSPTAERDTGRRGESNDHKSNADLSVPAKSSAFQHTGAAKASGSKEQAKRIQEEQQQQAEEEQKKLEELEELRKKQQELEQTRRKKLGSAFAFALDDDDKTEKDRVAKELAAAKRKAETRAAFLEPVPAGAASGGPLTSSRDVARVDAPMSGGGSNATDLHGAHHTHRFADAWKDWDAGKKDSPGEVARQMMKIAAIKRRGIPTINKGSRSRSRGNRRR